MKESKPKIKYVKKARMWVKSSMVDMGKKVVQKQTWHDTKPE